MGYKLWYCKTREEVHSKEPICVFPRSQRGILISYLQTCTEIGDLGQSEAKCFTQSVELIHKNPNEVAVNEIPVREGSSGAKKEVLRLAWAQERSFLDGFCGVSQANKTETSSVQENKGPSTSRGLDLNVAFVPDLNEEVVSPREEDNGCTLDPTIVEPDDIARSNGSGESENRIMRRASLSGLLAGSLVAGVKHNTGGAWDNAKKYIEMAMVVLGVEISYELSLKPLEQTPHLVPLAIDVDDSEVKLLSSVHFCSKIR